MKPAGICPRRFFGAGSPTNTLHPGCAVEREVDGYRELPGLAKPDPSLLIASHNEKLTTTNWTKKSATPSILAIPSRPNCSPERTCFPPQARALVSARPRGHTEMMGKVKGRILFRVPALHCPIFRRPVSANRPQQCHSGIIRDSRASPRSAFFPWLHMLQELPHCLPESRCRAPGRPLSSLFSGRLLFR